MVRIFSDKNGSGDYVIQTTAIDTDTFICELAEALQVAIGSLNDGGLAAMGILKNAMPIAFKLSGYKAETVSEQRTLVCGAVSPNACEVVASAGR
jgi:hypothetical protein